MTAVWQRSGHRQIGPLGTAVRLCVAVVMLVYVFATGPTGTELIAGLVLLPLVEMAVLWVVRPPGTPAFHLYGLVGYAVNFGMAGVLLAVWTTPAMIFYGASILLAVVRGYAGCEILALSNLVRRRDDQLACAVFSPIDALEQSAGDRSC